MPKGVEFEITDYTDGATEAVDEKSQDKKNEDGIDQRILDFKAQTNQFEQAQKEALEELYPEFYAAENLKEGIERYEPLAG